MGFLRFKADKWIFADPEIEDLHRNLREYIRKCKKAAKGGPNDEHTDKAHRMIDTLGMELRRSTIFI